jgi:hypothetical protein
MVVLPQVLVADANLGYEDIDLTIDPAAPPPTLVGGYIHTYIHTHMIDVDTSRTPEEGAHSPC